MKRFLVLLVVLAGGVAWAAFSIPSNAATVNGTDISQQDLNSDVSAIANSAYYQCYLNSEEYLSSEGSEEAPPVLGAGTGQYAGDHPTATTAFVASYLETEIGHELALQLAAERHVSVTPAGLVTGTSRPDRADHPGHVRDPPDAAGPERQLLLQPHRPGDHRQGGPGLAAGIVRRPAGAIRGRGHRTGGGPGRRRLEPGGPPELLRRARSEIRHRLHQRRRLSPARAQRRPRQRRSPSGPRSRHWCRTPPAVGAGRRAAIPCPNGSPVFPPMPASAAWRPVPSRHRSASTTCTCCCRSRRAHRRRTAT